MQPGENRLDMTVAGQLDDQAHAVAVGLVAEVADAFDLLVADQAGDLLDDPYFVSLVGNLGEDDLDSIARGGLFQVLLGANGESTTAGAIHPAQVFTILAGEDVAGGGEIRALDVLQDVVEGGVLVVEDRLDGAGQLGEVVWRDIAGHGDGDSGGAVE